MGGDFQQLQDTFKAQRMRLTYQRKVILDILRGTKSHPTADKVYAEAKRRIPNISLGTVYRTLNVLGEHGMILELDYGRGLSRFDGNPNPHYHVACVGCGKVEDVDMPIIDGIERRAERCTGYRVVGHRVEFQGVCPECVRG